jgi:putative addiction module CopG family antidote
MNVSLTPELEKKVRELVEAGVYTDVDELISDALRQLHDRRRTQREDDCRKTWMDATQQKPASPYSHEAK